MTAQLERCEQCEREPATVYAIDTVANGWGGYYCATCVQALRFQVIDRLDELTAAGCPECGGAMCSC
jgi:hypothetical protein